MIKRVKPFYRGNPLENMKKYIKSWDFWNEGIITELEDKIRDYCDRKHAIVTNSATNSIFMLLYIWSKKYPEKDQVLIPNWGFPAAYRACKALGLVPVALDMDKRTLGIAYDDLYLNLNNNTLAVVHVETNGVVGDPRPINTLLTDDILFIEDSAPSIVQDMAGTFGDASVFSFSPTKPLCASEGGAIVTDNDELAESIRNFRHIGDYNDLTASLNFSMSPFLAAYLIPQFDKVHIENVENERDWVHNAYNAFIDIFKEPYIETNRHGSVMYLSKNALKVSTRLTWFNIEHRYRHYPNFEKDIKMPISEQIRNEIIDLPMHHELTIDQIEYICTVIKRAEDE